VRKDSDTSDRREFVCQRVSVAATQPPMIVHTTFGFMCIFSINIYYTLNKFLKIIT
jgi:hypothetical protein